MEALDVTSVTYEEAVALCHAAATLAQAALDVREAARPCAGTYWRARPEVQAAIEAYNGSGQRKRQRVQLTVACPVQQGARKFYKNYKGPLPPAGMRDLCDACGASLARDVKKQFV